jgi:TRAP-type C4-dicarboxylate transport system permease small subunit
MQASEFPKEGRLESAARRLFSVAAIIIVPTITLLITADAVMRYAFEKPIAWAQDISGLGLFILFCAGLPYSWYGNFHVRMDLIYDVMPDFTRKVVDVLSVVAAVGFSGTLAIYAVQSVGSAYVNQTTMPLMPVPIWPVMLFGAVCFLLFCAAMIAWIVGRLSNRTSRS